jgi:hypothetical protein
MQALEFYIRQRNASYIDEKSLSIKRHKPDDNGDLWTNWSVSGTYNRTVHIKTHWSLN